MICAYREQSEELAIGEVLARGVEEWQLRARRALVGYEELAGVFIRELAGMGSFARVCTRRLRSTSWQLYPRGGQPHRRLAFGG
jgi:hypothetical protein